MFQINDVVVYGAAGVCRITGTEEKKLDGETKRYFVLKPKDDGGTTLFVPTWNEKALGKMRKVMTREDVDALIDSLPGREPIWVENEGSRKEAYTKILASGDQAAVASMLRALYFHKKEREAQGKRLHMADERFMKDAELLLYNEWQYVLNVDKAGLMDYIYERIEKPAEATAE